jgi:hypothetical protein
MAGNEPAEKVYTCFHKTMSRNNIILVLRHLGFEYILIIKGFSNYQENDIHTHQIYPKGSKLAKDPLVRSTLEQTNKKSNFRTRFTREFLLDIFISKSTDLFP